MQITCYETIARAVKTQMSEIYLFGKQWKLIAYRVFNIKKEAIFEKKLKYIINCMCTWSFWKTYKTSSINKILCFETQKLHAYHYNDKGMRSYSYINLLMLISLSSVFPNKNPKLNNFLIGKVLVVIILVRTYSICKKYTKM